MVGEGVPDVGPAQKPLLIPRFTFSLLLPATLATHDHHTYGRVSYILTARVEGVAETKGLASYFRRSTPEVIASDIPFKEDFDAVIARSDRLADEIARDSTPGSRRLSRSSSRDVQPANLASHFNSLGLGLHGQDTSALATEDGSAIAVAGEGSPTLTGLYHRKQSVDIQRSPAHGLVGLPPEDGRSIGSAESDKRTGKTGWLEGDLLASRSLIVHANPSPTGGVSVLDLRKEGFVDGLGPWRFSATADVVSTLFRVAIACADAAVLGILGSAAEPGLLFAVPQDDHLLRPACAVADVQAVLAAHAKRAAPPARGDA